MGMCKFLLIILLFCFIKSDAQSPMFKLISNGGSTPFAYLLDDYPGGVRSFSLRKLRSAYSGNCIKVRRSSDNTEQDIGFVSNVLDTASMKTFVGANSAFVTIWYDQSASSPQNAIQATTANQPRIMNSGVIDRTQNNDGDWVAAILFDGSNDFLAFSSIATAFGVDWSSFMVSKRVSSGTTSGFFSSTGVGTTTAFQVPSDNIAMYRLKTGNNAYYNIAADATATFSIFTSFDISDVPSIYRNGSAYSLGGDNFASLASTVITTIGNFFNSTYTNGYITEGIFYTSDQTGNRTGIEANINNFYQLY